MSKRIANGYCPEGLDYLPGFFRGQVAEEPHHPVRCLLEAFEADLHLVERFIENSNMLFDPQEILLFENKVRPATLTIRDLVAPRSLGSKLHSDELHQHRDEVSKFLWGKFSHREQDAIVRQMAAQDDSEDLAQALVEALNQIIVGPSIDDPIRFAAVKFSNRTRNLRGTDSLPTKLPLLNRLLLQDAYPSEIRALPERPALDKTHWEADWLQYLASYIDLDLDQEWLGRTDAQGESAMPRRSDENAAPRSATDTVFQEAPELYRQRGTPAGLVKLLSKLHGWDVEVLEHSWPAGMQLEVSSTIGEDTWLMDPLDQDRHFTVLLQPTKSNLERLGLQHLHTITNRLEFKLSGRAAGRRIETLRVPGRGGGDTVPMSLTLEAATSLDRAVAKLRNIIDQETPAHLRCYLALEAGAPPPKPVEFELVIGSDHGRFSSVIEHFFLN
jgi:hypothetical protein